jgi:hypothetical protein
MWHCMITTSLQQSAANALLIVVVVDSSYCDYTVGETSISHALDAVAQRYHTWRCMSAVRLNTKRYKCC